MTGPWIESAGTLGAALAFLGGGMVILCVALTYAELAAAMPSAGGEHVYSLRALGAKWSFVCSWAIVFGYMAVAAFEAVALPYALAQFFPAINKTTLWVIADWPVSLGSVMLGIAASIMITWINILGIRPAAFVQKLVTLGILLSGFVFLSGVTVNGSANFFEPLFVSGYQGVFTVLIMVPIMFVGFDVIPQTAEEINLPFETIGRLVVVSVMAAILWYVMMIIGVGFSLDQTARANAGLTTADASGAVWGDPMARTLLIIGGIAGILTSWNAFIVGASRLIFAMAVDGQLPRFLADIHPKYGTPYKALLLLGFINCLSPWFGRPVLIWLLNAGSFGVIVAYVLVSLAFLFLRVKEPQMPRPFKLKYGKIVGATALLLSIAMCLLFVPGSPAALAWPYEWGICLGWVLLGSLLWALGRRESALRSL